MKKNRLAGFGLLALAGWLSACQPQTDNKNPVQMKGDRFVEVELTTDLGHLSAKEKQTLRWLLETAQLMDDSFWTQAYGGRTALLASVDDEATRAFIHLCC